jgi:carboxymethylenebutenolidase
MPDLALPTADGDMPAYEAGPGAGARAAIVVVQEAFGLNDHIKSVCDRLATEGYHVVAPAMFHRSDSPTFAYDDFAGLMPVMQALTVEGISTDLHATYGHLNGLGYTEESIGITGFCMGGTIALWAAYDRPLGAAATWYGSGITQGRFGMPALAELAPQLTTPWLGLFGDKDRGIPVDDVEILREAAAKAAFPTEVVRYPEADHGFNCDARPSYHEASANDAWQRMLTWFDTYLPS